MESPHPTSIKVTLRMLTILLRRILHSWDCARSRLQFVVPTIGRRLPFPGGRIREGEDFRVDRTPRSRKISLRGSESSKTFRAACKPVETRSGQRERLILLPNFHRALNPGARGPRWQCQNPASPPVFQKASRFGWGHRRSANQPDGELLRSTRATRTGTTDRRYLVPTPSSAYRTRCTSSSGGP